MFLQLNSLCREISKIEIITLLFLFTSFSALSDNSIGIAVKKSLCSHLPEYKKQILKFALEMDKCFRENSDNYLCKEKYIGGLNYGLKKSTAKTCRNVFYGQIKKESRCLSLYKHGKQMDLELLIYMEHYGKIVLGLKDRLKQKYQCSRLSGTSLRKIKGQRFETKFGKMNGKYSYGGDAILNISVAPSNEINKLEFEERFHASTSFYLFLSKKTKDDYHNFIGFGPADVKRIRIQAWDGTELNFPAGFE